MFSDAQIWRGQLDTHFTYIYLILKKVFEDGNDIILEVNVMNALSYCIEIAGKTAVSLDSANLPLKAFLKKLNLTGIDAHDTHKVRWCQHKAEIFESAGITYPKKI